VRIRHGREDTSHELRETLWEKPQKHHVGFGCCLDNLHGQSHQARDASLLSSPPKRRFPGDTTRRCRVGLVARTEYVGSTTNEQRRPPPLPPTWYPGGPIAPRLANGQPYPALVFLSPVAAATWALDAVSPPRFRLRQTPQAGMSPWSSCRPMINQSLQIWRIMGIPLGS
jgi:hypothetical protein